MYDMYDKSEKLSQFADYFTVRSVTSIFVSTPPTQTCQMGIDAISIAEERTDFSGNGGNFVFSHMIL
jgi:hypothetical protein